MNNKWGFVCDNLFSDEIADVVCKQLLNTLTAKSLSWGEN